MLPISIYGSRQLLNVPRPRVFRRRQLQWIARRDFAGGRVEGEKKAHSSNYAEQRRSGSRDRAEWRAPCRRSSRLRPIGNLSYPNGDGDESTIPFLRRIKCYSHRFHDWPRTNANTLQAPQAALGSAGPNQKLRNGADSDTPGCRIGRPPHHASE